MRISTYLKLVEQSFQEFLIYRSTSFIISIFGLMFFSLEIIAGHVYFSFTNNLFGWSLEDYLSLVSTTAIMTYLYSVLFISSHEAMTDRIVDGQLDFLLLRPVNSFLYSIFYRIDIPSLLNLVVAVLYQIYLFRNYQINLLISIRYIGTILLGTWTIFLLNQLAITVTFWKDKISAITGIPENLIDYATRPARVYPFVIQAVFTWVIPVLNVTNLPIMVIKSERYYLNLAGLFIFNVIFTFIAVVLWNKGLTKYVSSE